MRIDGIVQMFKKNIPLCEEKSGRYATIWKGQFVNNLTFLILGNMDNMDKNYTVEALGYTFFKHAEQYDEALKEDIRKFKENFPDSELPEHMKTGFNVARALSTMACEIEKIKHFLGIKEIN